MEAYVKRFKVFQDTILTKIENGFDRYAAVVAFNEGFYQQKAKEQTFLSAIAYKPRLNSSGEPRRSNHLAKLVLEFISTTNWLSVYGLNYSETMQLSYAEWNRLKNQLLKIEAPKSQTERE